MNVRGILPPPLPRAAAMAAIFSLLTTIVLAFPALALFQDQDEDQPEMQALSGVFSVTITSDDIPRNMAGGPALSGLWNMTFNSDGTFSLARQDVGQIVNGTFEAQEATLSFTEWQGLVGCPIAEGDEPATYAWREEDETLTLTSIDDTCAERLTLLTTRSMGGFEACAVAARPLVDPFAPGADVGDFFATPVAEPLPVTGVAAQEGLSEGADAEEAIDNLLQQANGCWATGDPARFMALHSQAVVDELAFVGPVEDFARQLRLFMATPLVFKRIGPVNLIDPEHAWAYVEVTLGGDPLPQRLDFVFENGSWLFDTFFLFGPPESGVPTVVAP
jgi:hypothetical protein